MGGLGNQDYQYNQSNQNGQNNQNGVKANPGAAALQEAVRTEVFMILLPVHMCALATFMQ